MNFHNSTLLLSVSALLIAGCATTKISDPAPATASPAPATASGGYATATSSRLDPNETLTSTAKLLVLNQNDGSRSQQNITLMSSATGNNDDFVLSHGNTHITMTWDSISEMYFGSSGNTEFYVYPQWQSTQDQLVMAWINEVDISGSGTEFFGAIVTGFNSSPEDVAGRTGSATFVGDGQIYINSADGSSYSHAYGSSSLTADFNAMTISGQMDVANSGHDGGSGPSISHSSTIVTINPSSISSNTFGSSATINLADFGLQSSGTIDVDGMFYESGATGVGGYLTGQGVAISGGQTVLINGAFAAAE